MDNEVKPTWRLAWGIWWRWFLISLGICVVIGVVLLILNLVGVVCIPWESMCGGNSSCGWLPGV